MSLINSHAIQLQSSALGGLTTAVFSGGDLHSLSLGILVAIGSYAIINNGKPFTTWWNKSKLAFCKLKKLVLPPKKKSRKRK